MDQGTLAEAKNLVFEKNDASLVAALNAQTVTGDFVLENAIFNQNFSRQNIISVNVSNGSSTPSTFFMKNVVMSDHNLNQAADTVTVTGSNTLGTFKASNITLANNMCSSASGNRCRFNSTLTNRVYNNILHWNDVISPAGSAGSGNVDLGTTGGTNFLRPGDANGLDNIYFTADDGYNFVNSSASGVNSGVTGADIPAADILNRSRNGNTDVGAYESTP